MNTKKPIVHGYFLCYNEEYILPHLLRHYSKFCEKIYIIDNMSTDNSINIINSFINTEVIPYDSNGEVRDDIYLDIKNNIWKKSIGIADYVIVGDADEFLYHNDMEKFLTESFVNGITLFKPEGYHMIGDEDLILSSNDNILDKVTEGIIGSSNDKFMLFDCNKITNINYSFGCHTANPTGQIVLSNDNNLKMLHYKYLGLTDFIPKQKLRGDRLSQFNKINHLGSYYLYDAEKHKEEYKTFIQRRTKVL